jgi:6-phosphogluconolactonase
MERDLMKRDSMRFVALLAFCLVTVSAMADTLVYIGTYTEGDSSSEGIYVSKLDESSGALSKPVLAAALVNPSFVAIHPKRPLLYAVSEVSPAGPETIGVVAYAIEDDGMLTKLNARASGGAAACHLSVDPTGRCVGVANYGGGSCALFPISGDGSLGEVGSFHQHVGGSGVVANRQKAPHAHSINFNADGTQAFVADLGKDQILVFDVDARAGTMKPATPAFVELPPGGGPRHFCFHPDYRYAFTNLEITSQVALLRYDGAGLTLGPILSTLPASAAETRNSTAECLVHPSGRVVYVSNRGHNSIAGFEFDATSGNFRSIGNTSTQGEVPRGFGIDPSGRFLVAGNQKTGNVVSFRIDSETGELTSTGHAVDVDAAVNVRFYVR